jgi:hypothetical protein
MKSASLSILLSLSILFSKAQYVFTGNGAWSDVNNWQNGTKPSSTISSGSTVTIQGTATTSSGFPYDLGGNNGSLIIAAGGSLTINIETQFSNSGSVTVNGSLTSNTMWEAFNGSSVTVNGTFTNKKTLGNQGLITINNGGIINNTGNLDNTFINPIGQVVLNCGGAINNSGTFRPGNLTSSSCATITNSSVLSGNSIISGNLINAGTLAPGNSPGSYTINGDYTATSTAVHNFEVAGPSTGNYDVLNVSGIVFLTGTLNVSLINGFTPTTDQDIPIISGTINGTFAIANIPSSYSLVYNSNSVVLRHSSLLPVTFVAISIKKQNNGQKIDWEVQSEQGVSRYEIEKSRDGNHFITIGSVNAAGLNNYSFNDLMPETKCLYRVKSLDIADAYKYSTITLYSEGKSLVKLLAYPSVTDQKIVVQHPVAAADSKFFIIGSAGEIVKAVRLSIGASQTEINLSLLKPGIYILTFQNEKGEKQSIKIQKL